MLDASVSLAWRATSGGVQSLRRDDLDQIDIRSHTENYFAREVFELAGRYRLQGYAALYFDLARALSLPLATLDHGHIQAARQKHGVTRFVPDVCGMMK